MTFEEKQLKDLNAQMTFQNLMIGQMAVRQRRGNKKVVVVKVPFKYMWKSLLLESILIATIVGGVVWIMA